MAESPLGILVDNARKAVLCGELCDLIVLRNHNDIRELFYRDRVKGAFDHPFSVYESEQFVFSEADRAAGGNTCNGVTSADSASTLHAWEAIVELTGKNGVRRVPIRDFYIKAGTVDIRAEDGEIQTAILIPKASYENTFGHYIKYGLRNAMEIATLGCSVNVRLSPDKSVIERCRIAYGVAGPVPMRVPSAEAAANGAAPSLALAEAFSRAVLEDIRPRDSWRASKAFRQHIAVEMAKRALTESVRKAGGVMA